MYETRALTAIFRTLGRHHPRPSNLRKIFAAPTHKSSHRVFATSGYATPTAMVYPEQLLVYHAGTGRTSFVAFLKLNTIFLFAFSCIVVAPSLYYAPDRPDWIIPAIVIGGAIPMIFVTYTTKPYVSSVRIKLPGFARRSRDQLRQWVQRLPPTTEIALTTMWLSGRPCVSRMLLSDLRETKARWGIANLARASKSSASAARPWWKGKEPHIFYVANNCTRGRTSPITEAIALQQFIWQHIRDRIRKQ